MALLYPSEVLPAGMSPATGSPITDAVACGCAPVCEGIARAAVSRNPSPFPPAGRDSAVALNPPPCSLEPPASAVATDGMPVIVPTPAPMDAFKIAPMACTVPLLTLLTGVGEIHLARTFLPLSCCPTGLLLADRFTTELVLPYPMMRARTSSGESRWTMAGGAGREVGF